MLRPLLGCLLGGLLLAANATAGNWAHWRGPTGNGVAVDAQPPIRWSETENVKWRLAIPGRGSGSPVVWEDRVFVVTAVPTEVVPTEVSGGQAPARPGGAVPRGQRRRRAGRAPALAKLQFKVLCVNRQNGELLWERTAAEATPHQGTHSTNGFASASPCTDGKHLFAHFGSRGLYCYTLDGELKWKRDDLGQMNTRNSFGEGSSPTLAGDKILVPWDHEGQSYLFALDKRDGSTIWKTARDEPTCWATPLVIESKGKKQVIMNGETCVRAYDLETGSELWRCAGQTSRPAASPAAADGLVFVGSGFRGYFMAAFRPDGRGDIEGSDHVAWSLDRDTPDIASPLLSQGRLYFYKEKTGVFSCLDAATGKPHYLAQRVPGLSRIYASPVAAGGYLFLTGRSGTTVVLEDGPKFNVVATNSVGETVDATPAPVDNQLFIRGERHLFCIEAQ